jgi:uncharacterized protein YjbI with pentapeptide repeats
MVGRWIYRLVLGCVLLGGLCLGILALPQGAIAASPLDLDDARQDFTYANLSGKDFAGQNLSGSSLAAVEARETNFAGADLSQTILTKGKFHRANLAGVNLSQSFADRVIFDGADLTNAVVTEAFMTSTSFTEATIHGADFSGTILDRYQIVQMCKYADGVNPVTGVDTRDSLGCRG